MKALVAKGSSFKLPVWSDWLIIAAIFTTAFVVALASGNRKVNLYDESIIVMGATRVMAGAVIHRDFYANYGPAQFYVLAALFKMFGTSILVARTWGAAVKAAIAVAVYLLGRRVMPRPWSAVSCVFSFIWLSFVDNGIWPAWPALLAAIGSLHSLFTVFEKGQSVRNAAVAGVWVGIATLFRYDIGFSICVTEGLVLLAYGLAEADHRSRLRSVAASLGAYAAGVAIVCVPLGAAFLIAGAAGDLIFDVVSFPAKHYAATRSLPFPLPIPGRRPPIPAEYVVYLPSLILLGVLLTAIKRPRGSLAPRFRTDTDDSRSGMWELALLSAVMMGFIAKGFVRVGTTHMSLALVPAILILAGLLSANARRKVSVGFSAFMAVAMVATVLPTKGAYDSVRWRAAVGINHLTGRDQRNLEANETFDTYDTCQPADGLERIACYSIPNDEVAAVRFVDANTSASDSIFVGLPQHERIFVNDVGFYFVANRPPATKWYHFDPGLQSSEAIQKLMIGDLCRSQPKYVILDSRFEKSREPNDSAKSSGVKLLDHFIAQNYHYVDRFGSLTVLQRVNSPSAGGEYQPAVLSDLQDGTGAGVRPGSLRLSSDQHELATHPSPNRATLEVEAHE
jgi:hypothetical protein